MERKQEDTIDLLKLCKVLLNKAWLLIIVAILFAIVSFFSTGLYFQKKIGISVKATISEETIAMIIVKPSCENICPARPFINASGRYTTMVVIVDAITEEPTVLAPVKAAVL